MQTNALSMRFAQQRAFSLSKWLDAKSELFTLLCDETVTRRQVLHVHLVLMFMGTALLTAEASVVVALAFLGLAAHHACRLAREDGQQTEKQKGGER